MKLTEEEQLILKHRAEQDGRKPKKEGLLKSDLSNAKECNHCGHTWDFAY